MKQVELMKNRVFINLQLAEKSMNKNDFKMAMHHVQKARHSLSELRVIMIPVDHCTDSVINRLSNLQ